jgi:hypothetical protein
MSTMPLILSGLASIPFTNNNSLEPYIFSRRTRISPGLASVVSSAYWQRSLLNLVSKLLFLLATTISSI